MEDKKGAITLAEGSQKKDFRTDASMVLNSQVDRGHILRTAYDSLSIWKTKYGKNISPFYPRLKTSVRETALIDDEIWVFSIDATKSKDIIDAVTIGTQFFKVAPEYFLNSIYVKNLNAEGERTLDMKTLVRLNKDLYQKTVAAIKGACEHFNIQGNVDLHIYSSNINYKIPAESLHQALYEGGAEEVITDPRELNYRSGSNDNKLRAKIDTNLHIARLKI